MFFSVYNLKCVSAYRYYRILVIAIVPCRPFKFSISFGSDLRHIRFGSDIFFTIYPDLFPVWLALNPLSGLIGLQVWLVQYILFITEFVFVLLLKCLLSGLLRHFPLTTLALWLVQNIFPWHNLHIAYCMPHCHFWITHIAPCYILSFCCAAPIYTPNYYLKLSDDWSMLMCVCLWWLSVIWMSCCLSIHRIHNVCYLLMLIATSML